MPDNSHQSKGDKARAKALTPDERKAIASKGAATRWAKLEVPAGQRLHNAVAAGVLRLGPVELQCTVLDDEPNTRVLTQAGTPKSVSDPVLAQLPAFLRAKNLLHFISNDLICSTTPIIFEAEKGGGQGGRSLGFRAQLLPDVC